MAPPLSIPSPLLCYGPEAESLARASALQYGRLVGGEAPAQLRKGDARALVELLHRTVLGAPEAVVVGPLDEVAAATADVFLKTLEEPPPWGPRPYLWAWDLGGVAPTLRSRCRVLYAPGEDLRTEGHRPQARELFTAWLRGDSVAVIEELRDSKAELELVLRAMVEELLPGVRAGGPRAEAALHLWVRLRPLLGGSPLTPARVVSAMETAREGLRG